MLHDVRLGGHVYAHPDPGPAVHKVVPGPRVLYLAPGELQHLLWPFNLHHFVLDLHAKLYCCGCGLESDVKSITLRVDLVSPVGRDEISHERVVSLLHEVVRSRNRRRNSRRIF